MMNDCLLSFWSYCQVNILVFIFRNVWNRILGVKNMVASQLIAYGKYGTKNTLVKYSRIAQNQNQNNSIMRENTWFTYFALLLLSLSYWQTRIHVKSFVVLHRWWLTHPLIKKLLLAVVVTSTESYDWQCAENERLWNTQS